MKSRLCPFSVFHGWASNPAIDHWKWVVVVLGLKKKRRLIEVNFLVLRFFSYQFSLNSWRLTLHPCWWALLKRMRSNIKIVSWKIQRQQIIQLTPLSSWEQKFKLSLCVAGFSFAFYIFFIYCHSWKKSYLMGRRRPIAVFPVYLALPPCWLGIQMILSKVERSRCWTEGSWYPLSFLRQEDSRPSVM